MENLKPGDIVKGQVTGIENYGAFINIDDNYNGLIHISEISEGFVKDINDFVKVGESIYCRVLEVEDSTNNLKLSIKNINYRLTDENNYFNETVRGFSPLKDKLDGWIEEKKKEIEKNQQD